MVVIFEKIFESSVDYTKYELEFYKYIQKIERYKSLNFINVSQFGKKEEENTSIKKITVDIKGMVNNPGVYEVDSDSRINDVIALAGGLKEGADTSNINLAKIVSDEMTIIVYSTEEVLEKFKQEVCICNCPYIVNDACIGVDNNDNNLININTASIEELTTLTGIGDVKAEAIIKYRNEVGKFKTKEEILNVDGIGESLFEKIKDDITV